MTGALRSSSRETAPLRSTGPAPALVEAPKPAAAPPPHRIDLALTDETFARIEACCAISGETPRQLLAKALLEDLARREGATTFRRVLGLDEPRIEPRPLRSGCDGGCSTACAHVAAPSSEVARAVESFGPWPSLGEPCTS